MNEVPSFLVVTIDTECDKTATWHAAAPLGFKAVVEAVPNRLQPLFADFGIRPTYLLSPEILTHPESCAVLREARDVELAAHLHGEYLLPQMKSGGLAGSRTKDMQWEYPRQLEHAKLAVLTELFIQQFGSAPTSFRAGRFGASPNTARFLQQLGYVIDSSVTPHIRWTSQNGKKRPDYRRSDEMPYTLGPEGDIWKQGRSDFLELPITIVPAGALEGTDSRQPVWFRPWHSDTDKLIDVLNYALGQPPRGGVHRPLVMMFHNVELVPGASPYPQTEGEVVRYLDSLKRVFEHAESRDLRSCTMTEYHSAYMAGGVAGPDNRASGSRRENAWFRRLGRRARPSHG